jgi:hypothetical protein
MASVQRSLTAFYEKESVLQMSIMSRPTPVDTHTPRSSNHEVTLDESLAGGGFVLPLLLEAQQQRKQMSGLFQTR